MSVVPRFPAAATDMTRPELKALSKALFSVHEYNGPPSDMETTSFWVGETLAWHCDNAEIKLDEYVHAHEEPEFAPNNLTICNATRPRLGITPTTPLELFSATAVPATWVPCWHESLNHVPLLVSFTPVTFALGKSS